MTTESRLFSLGNIERFLFRPLFVFFSFVLVLLAIFQAGGRLSMSALSLFEEELNALLAGQNIVVQGLRGDWRGLNPVIRADVLSFPAGLIDDLEIELDVMESVVRNTPVLYRLNVADVAVYAEQTSTGWLLRGMGEQTLDIDVEQIWRLLHHSDELSGHVQLHLSNLAGETATLMADFELINRGGLHYGGVAVINSERADEQLDVQLWQRDKVLFVQDPANSGFVSGALMLPAVLSGTEGLTLKFADTFWRDEDERGGGMLNVQASHVQLPNSQELLSVQLGATAQRNGRHVRTMTGPLELTVTSDQLDLGPFYVDVQLPQSQPSQLEAAAELLVKSTPQPMLKVWLEQLDLQQLSTFFIQHVGDWKPAASWVRALSIEGKANNLHAYYDPDLGAGFLASVSGMRTQGYKGVPTLTNVQGRLWGYGQGMAMQVNGQDVDVKFPDLYYDGWVFETVQGVLKVWFGDGYFGMRGSHLKGRLGGSHVGAGFSITRPQERLEQRLSLQINVDEVDLLEAKAFVPFNIPAGFADWLERGPRGGQLSDAQFALHGQILVPPGVLGRRMELTSKISDGRVEYDPAWPEISELQGDLHVAGVDTRIKVASARSGDVLVDGADIVLHNNARYVAGTVETQTDAVAALGFVRSSPLLDTLDFITPGWQGSGALNLRANLLIPINVEEAPPLRVDLQFFLDGFGLDMPDYRVAVSDLRGGGSYSLPHNLTGDFAGKLLERPADFHARFDENWLRFDIKGSGTPADVYALLATDYEVPISGQFDFDGTLSLAMAGGVTNLSMTTELAGLQVDLPRPFGKTAAASINSELEVQFLSAYESVRWRYQDANGWFHYDDGIARGALGIGAPPPMTAEKETAVVVGGRMAEVLLDEWVTDPDEESTVALPFDWVLQDLAIERFLIDELAFENLTVNGAQRGEDMNFRFDGPTLRGVVDLPAVGAMALNLDYIQVPDPDAGVEVHVGAPSEDPITVDVGRSLPAASVFIAQLDVGDEPFGAWRFTVEPQEHQVLFKPFAADVNGVHIKDATLAWNLVDDRSSFQGKIDLDDLAQTLPKWDYAASVTTEQAAVKAELDWPGSPVNVSVLGSTGEFKFIAREGRFIEVDSGTGGLRILGLLNFTKFAKRINFDISDITGEGIHFDKIDADVKLKQGQLSFPERMVIDSSSGNYEVGGQVNLRSGALDNEMIVTLPVSKSLPWYGVYLALANPLVGLGVVVGERVLRKPIEQFSSAKFEVTGTLDDPEVNFVSLWDRSMKDPAAEEDRSLLESTP